MTDNATDPGIDFQDVTVRVVVGGDSRTVLADVTLTLTERRITVVGANGSGKSTLLRLVNGLTLPTSGRVTVAGLDTARHGRDVRRRVGFVSVDGA